MRERVDSVVYLIDSYFEKENSLGGSVFSGILLLGCISKQEQLEVLISVSEGEANRRFELQLLSIFPDTCNVVKWDIIFYTTYGIVIKKC